MNYNTSMFEGIRGKIEGITQRHVVDSGINPIYFSSPIQSALEGDVKKGKDPIHTLRTARVVQALEDVIKASFEIPTVPLRIAKAILWDIWILNQAFTEFEERIRSGGDTSSVILRAAQRLRMTLVPNYYLVGQAPNNLFMIHRRAPSIILSRSPTLNLRNVSKWDLPTQVDFLHELPAAVYRRVVGRLMNIPLIGWGLHIPYVLWMTYWNRRLKAK